MMTNLKQKPVALPPARIVNNSAWTDAADTLPCPARISVRADIFNFRSIELHKSYSNSPLANWAFSLSTSLTICSAAWLIASLVVSA